MTDGPKNKHSTGWPTVRRLFDFEQAADFAGVPIQEISYQIRMGKLKPRELEW